MIYSLPCTCGKRHNVEASQAGQTITCTCGKAIEVPSLRGLRALAPAGDAPIIATTVADKKPPQWSSLQSWLFGLGLVLLVAAVPVCAFGFYTFSQIDTTRPENVQLTDEAYDAHVDKLGPSDLLDEWNRILLPANQPRYSPPRFVIHRWVAAERKMIGIVGAVCGVVALGLMGLALVLRPSPSRR